MKKLFHRKKHSNPSSPEQTPSHNRQPRGVTSDPALRSTLYASTTSAGAPQTGAYPLKGNNSSVALHGRRSGTHSRGQQSTGPGAYHAPDQQDKSLPTPQTASASHGNYVPSNSSQSKESTATRRYQQEDLPDGNVLSHDLSNLNIHAQNGQPESTRDTPQRFGYQAGNITGSRDPRYSSGLRGRAKGDEGSPGVRLVGNTEPAQQATEPAYRNDRDQSLFATEPTVEPAKYGYTHQPSQPLDTAHFEYANDPRLHDDTRIKRKNSIPRKQLASSTETPNFAHPRSNAPMRPVDHYNSRDRNPALPTGRFELPQNQPGRDTSKGFTRMGYSEPATQGTSSDAEDVLERAKSNTYDTEVIEKYAPAVVHERVHQDVHHVREEQITREIHNHDVFHRILPIIDVEVLPPRHFLPVEGGGLVEISGHDVPGRGNNWVVAETASKIPSDQPMPKTLKQFSAREFKGSEGDAVRYTAPEGHERTEQTWVHPPELETGARETGQTWPMEFDGKGKLKIGHKDPKSSKSSSSKKAALSDSSAAQQSRVY